MTRLRFAFVMSLLLSLALLTPADPAAAGAITVTRFDDPAPAGACDPGDCSLREAVMAANAAPGPNSIALAAGTYSLTIEGDGDSVGSIGDLDVNDDLTLTGRGPSSTVIDGNWPSDPDRIIEINGAGRDLVLSGLTIRDGDLGTSDEGAGVRVSASSTLTATDVDLVNNRGRYNGGVDNYGTTSLERVRFIENHGNDGAGSGCCGGFYNEGGGTATMNDVAFIRNTGVDDSAAIYTAGTSLSMTDVSFIENTSGSTGGVLFIAGSTVDITNATFSGNTLTTQNGGAIYLQSGTVDLNNVTITGNHAGEDGGGFYRQSGTATIRNSIIAGNTDGGSDQPDCGQASGSSFTSGGNNLVGSTTGCTFTAGTGDLLNVDPRLGPLADNGGFTQTHALLPGSPAINAAGSGCPSEDQRGAPRRDCDIGAYERVFCSGILVNRVGTDRKDTLRGTGGKDGMLGLGGRDTLSGKGGKDGLCGGAGKDKLKGGAGKDRLKGQGGRDTCIGGGGTDRATCERERTVP